MLSLPRMFLLMSIMVGGQISVLPTRSKKEPLEWPKNESSLAKFLREPELGKSWYDPAGPTPTFFRDQRNGTKYRARLGADALIDCKVTSVEKDLVSWFRRDESGLPEVLTVGFMPHSAENRFLLDFEPPNNYRLRVKRVEWGDEGVYMCQLAVHPPELMWSFLHVVRPIVHLLDGEAHPVRELHYDSGSTIDLLCRIRRPPRFQVSVLWESRPKAQDKVITLNNDIVRGGVKIDTGLDEDTGLLLSRLKLFRARESDTGSYTCRLVNLPLTGKTELQSMNLSDTISVFVIRGENSEAIYGQASHMTWITETLVMCHVLLVLLLTG